LIAFASASNDVASDGFYLIALERPTIFFWVSAVPFTDFQCLPEMGNCNHWFRIEQQYGDKQKHGLIQ
jgi:hypothetical protein